VHQPEESKHDDRCVFGFPSRLPVTPSPMLLLRRTATSGNSLNIRRSLISSGQMCTGFLCMPSPRPDRRSSPYANLPVGRPHESRDRSYLHKLFHLLRDAFLNFYISGSSKQPVRMLNRVHAHRRVPSIKLRRYFNLS
jgi:hypothetical protein